MADSKAVSKAIEEAAEAMKQERRAGKAKAATKPVPRPKPAPRPVAPAAPAAAAKKPERKARVKASLEKLAARHAPSLKKLSRAKPVVKTSKPARKPRKAAKARKPTVPVQRQQVKIIQGADALALKTLVEGVKRNHLEAEKVFRAAAEKLPARVHHRAAMLIEQMGLLPTTAGHLAIRVAELEDEMAGYEVVEPAPEAAA